MPETPYFAYDLSQVYYKLDKYRDRKFSLYYSTKAFLYKGLVKEISNDLDGFSVPSVHDLIMVRKETMKPIHFVSPMIREYEIDLINKHATSVSFNNLEQYHRLKKKIHPSIDVYLRINPGKSFLRGLRYDPAKWFLHLGVNFDQFLKYIDAGNEVLNIHFHSNCQGDNIKDVKNLFDYIFSGRKQLEGVKKVNMGGGYLYSPGLVDFLNSFKDQLSEGKYLTSLIFEPGYDIINDAGSLYTSVVDIFQHKEGINKRNVAILDTSINHMPEVFDYYTAPDIKEPKKVFLLSDIKYEDSEYTKLVDGEIVEYALQGCTCFPGDFLNAYSFKGGPLKIGQTIIFDKVGAYSYIKSNTFNGIPLPGVLFYHSLKNVRKM